jgi:hypothetical protein
MTCVHCSVCNEVYLLNSIYWSAYTYVYCSVCTEVFVLKYIYWNVFLKIYVLKFVEGKRRIWFKISGREKMKFKICDDTYDDSNDYYCVHDCNDYLLTVLAVLVIIMLSQIHIIVLHVNKIIAWFRSDSQGKIINNKDFCKNFIYVFETT